MNSVLEKLRKKDSRDDVRRFSNGADKISIATDNPLHLDKGITLLNACNGTEQITIQDFCVLAQNIDHLLADSSALTFFIQFLECYDKLNLVKFWIHVEGFKASLGEERVGCSQDAETSLALLDARNIFSRYIDTDSACSISLPKKISERVFARLSEGSISADIFDDAKNFVHSLFDLRYFKDFENSVYHKKYQLHVFSRCCSLDDILYVPALLNAFLEFVDDRHDHDCLQFLIACNAFEKNYNSLSDEEALEDAMSIYDKYFSMQALSPIRIGDTARMRMESEICTDSGRPLQSSFRSAKQLCFLRIREIELPRPNREIKCGSSSSDSQALLFDHHFDIPEFKRTPSRSSQQSPLLTKRNRSLILGSTTKYRTYSNLAEVDCMGQYRVLYDDSLAQETSTPAKIRQKLRKYLDKSTLKEEEVALEVARTIIADVHSMVEAGKR